MFRNPQPRWLGADRRGPRPLPYVRFTLLVSLGSRIAFAQPPPVTPSPNPDPSPPSPPEASAPPAASAPSAEPGAPADDADLASIEAALAKDTAAASTPPLTPTPASGAPQSMNPEISVIADFALAAFSPNQPHQTGGHDPAHSGFNLQALELSLGASVDPYLRFDTHLAFSLDGVELEEAYATTLGLPGRLQARFGQFLTRFGRLNPTHPHAWEFADQPFVLGRFFGGEGNRGLGLELSYLTPLPWYVELVASATGADGEDTARSFYGADNPAVDGPSDLLYVGALKQFFELSADWSLFWGLSAAFGPNASGDDHRSEIYGTDLYLKFRPITAQAPPVVSLQTEWLYRRRQLETNTLHDYGGYAQLMYRFAQRWSGAGRFEYGSITRDQNGDPAPDPLDPEWTKNRRRWSLALTHYPTEFSRFRLQGARDVGLEPSVWSVFLAAEVAIGAHGAHSF